jgi:hypothetical protein
MKPRTLWLDQEKEADGDDVQCLLVRLRLMLLLKSYNWF